MDHYDYYEEVCTCEEISNGSDAGIYDFMDELCVCGYGVPNIIYLGMRDLDDNEVSTWPVTAYNINEEEIGDAGTRDQYIAQWNSDPANQAIGILGPGFGAFGFTLVLIPGQTAPPWVIGEPGEVEVDLGIYGMQYGDEYE